jgi:signal transduction histidine kinase
VIEPDEIAVGIAVRRVDLDRLHLVRELERRVDDPALDVRGPGDQRVAVPESDRLTVPPRHLLAQVRPHKFTAEEAQRLQPLANAAAIALENIRLYNQLRKELNERIVAENKAVDLSRQFLTLQYAGATIASSLDFQHVLRTFSKEMVDLLKSEACIISAWNDSRQEISVIGRHAPENWWQARTTEAVYNLSDIPLIKWVILERRAEYLTINQVDIDPADLAYMQAHQLKTLLILPMEFQDRVIGLVEVVDTQVERFFTTDEIAFTQLLANQAAAAIENARLYARARQELNVRKEIEQELRRLAARNKAILDAIPDSLFYLSREGQVLDYKVHNYDDLPPSSANFVGQNLSDMLWLPATVSDELGTHIHKALTTHTVQIVEYQRPGLVGMQDFEARLVANGENEVLAMVRNITERKQAEQQIIRTERLAALGQLAAALAHEINNPLQVMQSNLDLILGYSLPLQEREQYLHVIRRQIERVNKITGEVLNFARPTPSPNQPISLLEQIEQVLLLIGKRLEQSNIQVVVAAQPHLPPLVANPDQLIQVFLNLVLNAIEAIEQEGQINISLYVEEDNLVASFTSDGPAIPSELLPHIFEPFFTTKSEGSGLGLWISHSLIQQHNGTLSVENLPGERGVIFTVRLPFIAPAPNKFL